MKKKNLKKVATQKMEMNSEFRIKAIWKYLFSVMIIIFVALAFFGGSDLPKNDAVANDWSENRVTANGIQAAQKLIEKFEAEYDQFRELALSKIANLSAGDKRADLEAVFGLFEINRTNNPHRNVYGWIKKLQAENDSRSAQICDKRFFNYGIQGIDAWGWEMEQNFLASFSPSTRTVYLRKNVNHQDLFTMVVVYHELVHVLQDTFLRKLIDSQEKEEVYYGMITGDKPTIIIDYELEAYCFEFELIDLLLDGQFSQGYKQSKPLSRTELGQKLNVLPTEQEFLEPVIQFAEYYYCNKPELFFEKLVTIYREMDYRILIIENLDEFEFREI